MKKKVFIFLLPVLFLSSCSYFISGNLGNNLYLMEGDSETDRIVVLCANKDIFGCYSGACIVPPNKLKLNKQGQFNEKYYSEYVKTVKSNKKYVLVKTYSDIIKKNNYWLIDKSFNENNTQAETIISFYLTGQLDSIQFYRLIQEKNIDLKFKD